MICPWAALAARGLEHARDAPAALGADIRVAGAVARGARKEPRFWQGENHYISWGYSWYFEVIFANFSWEECSSFPVGTKKQQIQACSIQVRPKGKSFFEPNLVC